MLFTGSHLWFSLLPCLAMASPTVGWALLHQLAIKKVPHRSGLRASNLSNSSVAVPLSHMTLGCNDLTARAMTPPNHERRRNNNLNLRYALMKEGGEFSLGGK